MFINEHMPVHVRFKIPLEKLKPKEPQNMPVRDMALVQVSLENDLARFSHWRDHLKAKKPRDAPKFKAGAAIDVILTMYILH